MDLYDAGVAYMRAGLAILALTGKKPNGAFHPQGATPAWRPFSPSDEDVATHWWAATKHRDTTGVGIVISPHLCVIDVDGEEGAVALQKLIGEKVPETAVAKTSRGLHLWFLSPRVIRSMKLAPMLDCKGHGGYACAPPSVHPDTGLRYEWLWPLVNDHGVVEVDWLPEAIESIAERREIPLGTLATEAHGGSIDGLVRHLRAQEPGNRNSSLYWAACAARDDGHPLKVALAELAPATGLPLAEARRTIRSAYKEGEG